MLGLAFDLGIRLYDTAPIYGFGLSEQRLGNYFKHKREDVFFISKSGVDWHDSKRVNMTNDPAVTQKMLENSLRDLQSDYIDLYMIHCQMIMLIYEDRWRSSQMLNYKGR